MMSWLRLEHGMAKYSSQCLEFHGNSMSPLNFQLSSCYFIPRRSTCLVHAHADPDTRVVRVNSLDIDMGWDVMLS